MVAASLSTVAQGGRVVELSKRGIWSAARVSQERPDVAYSLLAVDFLPPGSLNVALTRVSASMAAGAPYTPHALQPSPIPYPNPHFTD